MSVISFVVGITGIILAVLFYSRSKKIKLPYYTIQSINMVEDLGGKFRSLRISYLGRRIRNFTVTKIAFWNAGGNTISRQDIAAAEPLRVMVKKGQEILDAKTHQVNNSASKFSVRITKDRRRAKIGFEYLDKGDGAVIRLLHTGVSSDDVEISGRIMGVSRLIKKNVRAPPNAPSVRFLRRLTPRRIQNLLASVAFVFPIIFIVGFLSTMRPVESVPDLLVPILSIGLILVVYWGIAFSSVRNRLPKGLEKYWED